jgi:hypothetical protein
MPAALDEAFTSPFIQFKDLNPHGPLHKNSWETGAQAGPGMQEIPEKKQVRDEGPPFVVKETLPLPIAAPAPVLAPPAPLNMEHDCDRLIARILSCPKCRLRLSQILNNSVGQIGGAPAGLALQWDSLSSTVIGNFLFGIALIFLVDRIIRSRS